MKSKIKKLLTASKVIIKKPYMINKIIDDESVHKDSVYKNFKLENGLDVVSINNFFQQTSITIDPLSFCDGSSTILDMALLKSLAVDKDYFEIGTWRGESASIVSKVSKTCTTFNLSPEQISSLNLPQEYVDQHFYFSKNNKDIKQILGNSLTFDFSPFYKKIDMVFVDGDHHYESVKKDTETAFKLLKNDTSIIVWHDYGRTVSDVRFDILRGILEGTPSDKQKNLFRVKNTLCAIYFPFEIKSFPPAICDQVEDVYKISIEKIENNFS